MPPSECANPLLLEFVSEWLETARMRSSKGVTTYKKAYDSLKACPLKFQHPSEAKQLTGFGDKLCSRLTEKLKEHCEETGEPMPQLPHKRRKKGTTTDGDEEAEGEEGDTPVKKPRKTNPKHTCRHCGQGRMLLYSLFDSGGTRKVRNDQARSHRIGAAAL